MVTEEGQRLDEGSRGGGRGDDKGKFDWKKKGWKPPLPNQRDSDLRELSREREREQVTNTYYVSLDFCFPLTLLQEPNTMASIFLSLASLWKYSMAPFSCQKCCCMRNRFQEKVTG